MAEQNLQAFIAAARQDPALPALLSSTAAADALTQAGLKPETVEPELAEIQSPAELRRRQGAFTNGPAGLDPGSRAFPCSELAQFPADLEGIAGMLLVDHQDQGGDQQQADHGDARPEAGRPACRPALARADRSIAPAAARRLVEPFHGRRWRARLVIHSDATWQGQVPAMGGCLWSAIGARQDNQAAAQAVFDAKPWPSLTSKHRDE
jgi:hypothetical protein